MFPNNYHVGSLKLKHRNAVTIGDCNHASIICIWEVLQGRNTLQGKLPLGFTTGNF